MTRTLLLADGSITIQRVIELTFAHEDVRVTSVGDGRKAMQVLESEAPDVVLVDVDLPEMDGFALTAHIRRVPRLKNVPVLLLAGAFEPVDHGRAREVGSDGVIIKPFEPQVVVTRVKELIDQKDRLASPLTKPTEAAVTAGAAASRAAAPAVEPPAPEPQRSQRPEPAFIRMAARDRDASATEPPQAVETLELPVRSLWDTSATPAPAAQTLPGAGMPHAMPQMAPLVMPTAAPPPKVTLASAFTALLAAEQSAQPAGLPPIALSEASVEDAVRRVLVRMTDDLVRRIVLDTAERLIREEIEKIKANPD